MTHMEQKKYLCPCCGEDLTAFIENEAKKIIENDKKRQYELSKERQRIKQEKTLKTLKQWRDDNPEKVIQIAQKACSSRTKESFKKQAESLKHSNEMKMIKFAELVMEARSNGVEITAEINKELMKKARELAKKEIAESKKKVRSLKIQ
jgi:hypothetical protein